MITKTMVILKTRRSTPRRVLNTEPELLPKALPRPAPRTWRRIKKITAMLRIISMMRIAGSHCEAKFFLHDSIIHLARREYTVTSTLYSQGLYHTKDDQSRHYNVFVAVLVAALCACS